MYCDMLLKIPVHSGKSAISGTFFRDFPAALVSSCILFAYQFLLNLA